MIGGLAVKKILESAIKEHLTNVDKLIEYYSPCINVYRCYCVTYDGMCIDVKINNEYKYAEVLNCNGSSYTMPFEISCLIQPTLF